MRARWIPGLDGLRAVAVIAVVLFHLSSAYVPGGFLGVDLFFVISGYLITRLLLGEAITTGRIRLGAFYRRRVRRLLPAVLLLLTVVLLAGSYLWRDQRPTLNGSVLSSLFYVTNWWQIADQQSYFVAMGRPPMLQHLWSLAIEEQYYILWAPLVLIVVAVAARRFASRGLASRGIVARGLGARGLVARGGAASSGRAASGSRGGRDAAAVDSAAVRAVPARTLLIVAGVAAVLAVASTIAMAVISLRTGVPDDADSSRVYFGTDTHTMGLLLGSAAGALAAREPGMTIAPGWLRRTFAWRLWRAVAVRDDGATRRPPGWMTDAVTVAGLAGLVWWMATVDEYQPWMYTGGFLAFSALALVVVCGAARRVGHIGRLLDAPPLRWIGQRSYGIYLWHWPVFVVTRPMIDVAGPTWLLDLARAGLAVAIAAVSYRYVEVPLRRGVLRRGDFRRAVFRRGVLGRGDRARPGVATAVERARRWTVPAAGIGCAAILLAASIPVRHSPELVSVPGTAAADPGVAGGAADPEGPGPGGAAGSGVAGPGGAAGLGAAGGQGTAGAGGPAVPLESTAAAGSSTVTVPALPSTRTPVTSASAVAATNTAAPPATSTAASAATSTETARPTTHKPAPKTSAQTAPAPAHKPAPTKPRPSTHQGVPVRDAAVSAFGDSVLLGAAPALQNEVGSMTLDAVVGRQARETLDDVAAAHRRRTLAPNVVIHTGSNGIISPGRLADTLESLADRRRVVLINDHVDRTWESPNNKTISAAAKRFKNVVVVDWDAAATKNPGWLGPDGVHVNQAGAHGYAALVARAIGS